MTIQTSPAELPQHYVADERFGGGEAFPPIASESCGRSPLTRSYCLSRRSRSGSSPGRP
jgi:hypothetical protein